MVYRAIFGCHTAGVRNFFLHLVRDQGQPRSNQVGVIQNSIFQTHYTNKNNRKENRNKCGQQQWIESDFFFVFPSPLVTSKIYRFIFICTYLFSDYPRFIFVTLVQNSYKRYSNTSFDSINTNKSDLDAIRQINNACKKEKLSYL